MATVYLGLGTNLGDKPANLQFALDSISGQQIGVISSMSPVYQSEAWGYTSDNSFLNMVVCAETELAPEALLNACQRIEIAAGRETKSGRDYADRVLDLDILYYDKLVLHQNKLSIPHPLIAERKFVLQPLCDIAPFFVDPALGNTITDMLMACTDKTRIQKIELTLR
ncbi:MAG: 2-amino-4-hydroxy-6-hydroxymethyldihydropteridine diphosphokinase [Paludibacteraceae bacterium]|nr:2-amino-4-hydroxy-6-hydroxymethyldihydropteridine diphosphokinase [Paludibacteraceae bacterium]